MASFHDTSAIQLQKTGGSAEISSGTLNIRATPESVANGAYATLKLLSEHATRPDLRRIVISFEDTPGLRSSEINPIATRLATWIHQGPKGSEEDSRSASLTHLPPAVADKLHTMRFDKIFSISANENTPAQSAASRITQFAPTADLAPLKTPKSDLSIAKSNNSAVINAREPFASEASVREVLEQLGNGLEAIDVRLQWGSDQNAYAKVLGRLLPEHLAPTGTLVFHVQSSPDRLDTSGEDSSISVSGNRASIRFTTGHVNLSDIETARGLIGEKRDSISIDLTASSVLRGTEAMTLVALNRHLSSSGTLEITFHEGSKIETSLNEQHEDLLKRCQLRPIRS